MMHSPPARFSDPMSAQKRAPSILALCAGIVFGLVGATAVASGQGTNTPSRAVAEPGSTDASAVAIDAMQGAVVQGDIAGLRVEVTSVIAYRDWMPGVGLERGEDGGSPLHVVVGLALSNSGSKPLRLDRAARLGMSGEALAAIVLDDLSGTTVWPLVVAPGEPVRLQLGTRNGPMLPVGASLALEIDLRETGGGAVEISFSSLPVGRTD
jgi:hypothetical protein